MATRTTVQNSRPSALIDPNYRPSNDGRQIDWDAVPVKFQNGAVAVTVGTGGAAQGATSVPVVALSKELKAGTTLDFGGAKFARLTAAAAVGATSITAAALPTAVVAGDIAYSGGTPGLKIIPQFTVMAELSTGKIIPRSAVTGAEEAAYILATEAIENSQVASLSGYGVYRGGGFFDNLLPEATGSPKVISSTWKTELGGRFWFEQYADSTS